MRARQSVDLSTHQANDSTILSPSSSTPATATAAAHHRRSNSHAVSGHARRASQSLAGAATLELIQAQAANHAQGGESNPVALINQIAAANHPQSMQQQQQQQHQQGTAVTLPLQQHPGAAMDPSAMYHQHGAPPMMNHPGVPGVGYMNSAGGHMNDVNQAAKAMGGMQINSPHIPAPLVGQQQQGPIANSNLGVGGGYPGMNNTNAMYGPAGGYGMNGHVGNAMASRRGRMSNGPHVGQGHGVYPYAPMQMNGKVLAMNGIPGRLPGTLPNGQMDPAQMTGNYGPAAAAAAAAAAGNTTGRTVYVGNLPPDASVDELMNLVRFGPVESVRLLPEKSCVFISFLDGATAAAFHADATVKKLTLHGQELKIGWGKPSVVPSQVVQAIAMAKATRNVYLGGLDENLTESELRDDLCRFGPIDQVKIVRDKGIGFVHFLSISAAMKVVATLPTETEWEGKRVGYGKDRCAYVPRAQQAAVQAAQQQAAAALGHTLGMPGAPFQAFNPLSPATLYSSNFSSPTLRQTGFENQDPYNNAMSNRCVYIGSIPEDAKTSDVCDAVRGGLIAQVRYLEDKHYAFVTFADPTEAATFFQQATTAGLMINNQKVRVSWGRAASHVSPAVMASIASGATRNVYIGNIEDFEKFTEEKLRQDFSEFGEIEQINFLPSKKAAFVNFCGVGHASKAIDRITSNPDYAAPIRVSYGKDRCANQPRPNHFGATPRSARGDSSPNTPLTVGTPTAEEAKAAGGGSGGGGGALDEQQSTAAGLEDTPTKPQATKDQAVAPTDESKAETPIEEPAVAKE